MKIGPGRNPKRIKISDVREVSPEEFAEASKSSPPVVKRFRESHHMMARLVAMGMSPGQVARAMGMTVTRVGMFRSDPAFQNLVAEYRAIITQEWAEEAAPVVRLMQHGLNMGVRQIVDQMEEVDEGAPQIPVPTLLKVTSDFADRLGYAKRTVNITVDGTFASKLDRAIERSGLLAQSTSQTGSEQAPNHMLIESRAQPPEVEAEPKAEGPQSSQPAFGLPLLERRA